MVPPFGSRQFPVARGGNSSSPEDARRGHRSANAAARRHKRQGLPVDSTIKFGEELRTNKRQRRSAISAAARRIQAMRIAGWPVVNKQGRIKYGFGMNLEQELTHTLRAYGRIRLEQRQDRIVRYIWRACC